MYMTEVARAPPWAGAGTVYVAETDEFLRRQMQMLLIDGFGIENTSFHYGMQTWA